MQYNNQMVRAIANRGINMVTQMQLDKQQDQTAQVTTKTISYIKSKCNTVANNRNEYQVIQTAKIYDSEYMHETVESTRQQCSCNIGDTSDTRQDAVKHVYRPPEKLVEQI